jgi:hypothetical protein
MVLHVDESQIEEKAKSNGEISEDNIVTLND